MHSSILLHQLHSWPNLVFHSSSHSSKPLFKWLLWLFTPAVSMTENRDVVFSRATHPVHVQAWSVTIGKGPVYCTCWFGKVIRNILLYQTMLWTGPVGSMPWILRLTRVSKISGYVTQDCQKNLNTSALYIYSASWPLFPFATIGTYNVKWPVVLLGLIQDVLTTKAPRYCFSVLN